MAQKVKLNNVRPAFAHDLWVATNKSDDKSAAPKYGCTFLISPTDPQVKKINEAIEAAAQEKWGAKSATILKSLRATEKAGLRDGDLKSYVGFAGNLYVSASNAMRPTIIDKDKTQLAQSDGKPYSGCYVNVSLEFWAYDHPKGGKGISCTVLGVQFAGDGEKFGSGSGVASEDDFDDVSEGATADDLA